MSEVPGALGIALWRVLSDVLLWCETPPAERASLYAVDGLRAAEGESPTDEPSIAIARIRQAMLAGEIGGSTIAAACREIAQWAERERLWETAMSFAEAAARAAPEDATVCYEAGVLCGMRLRTQRAAMLLQRAIRLARLARSEAAFANAHRGYGYLLAGLGRFAQAERHFWKSVRAALRIGQHGLAGQAYHNLMAVSGHLDRREDAIMFARRAAELYRGDHPRLPNLAYDIALLWCNEGYYSSALPVFERVAQLIAGKREEILAVAGVALAAAVVRDNVRYRRAAAIVVQMADGAVEFSAGALYHVGEGARCFHDWEAAQHFTHTARKLAEKAGDMPVIELLSKLEAAVRQRVPGPVDRVPPTGGTIDGTQARLFRKMKARPFPRTHGLTGY